jgi:hypothetical protein
MKKNKFIAFSVVILIIYASLAVSSSDSCYYGDESCKDEVIAMLNDDLNADVQYVDNGTFHVRYSSLVDGSYQLHSYQVDCNCKLKYRDGYKVE